MVDREAEALQWRVMEAIEKGYKKVVVARAEISWMKLRSYLKGVSVGRRQRRAVVVVPSEVGISDVEAKALALVNSDITYKDGILLIEPKLIRKLKRSDP